MKTLHSVTRSVRFYVLADDENEAKKLAIEVCPIDEYPAQASLDTRVYCTPNQDADLKRLAINYE